MRRSALIAAAVALASCQKPAGDPPPGPAPSVRLPVAPSAPTPSAPAPIAPAGASAPELAPGTSKAPTVKEWRDGRTLDVRFARSLWCEARVVREWLRVSCRSAENAPNTVQTVTRSGGAGGEVYTFMDERVASAVVAVRKGTDVQLTYKWTSWGERTLSVRYPKDAEAPRIGFDHAAPRGQSGLPLCADVCFVPFHHHVTGACERPPPCESGFRCETWHDSGEIIGMCVCSTECDPGAEAPEGTNL